MELLEPNASFPITIPRTHDTMQQLGLSLEQDYDVIVLNICENQMDGKMTTWFKYASMMKIPTHKIGL